MTYRPGFAILLPIMAWAILGLVLDGINGIRGMTDMQTQVWALGGCGMVMLQTVYLYRHKAEIPEILGDE